MGQSVPGDRIAALLLGGMHDPSVDVRIEALKATRGILDEGMLTRDRKMFGPQLVETAVRVRAA
jgi:hypothetical protein